MRHRCGLFQTLDVAATFCEFHPENARRDDATAAAAAGGADLEKLLREIDRAPLLLRPRLRVRREQA